MHARATILEQADPDEATRVLREQVLPHARQLDGFRGAIGLVDRSNRKAIAYTLWESETAMTASEEAANQMRSDAVQAIGASTPTVERYDVAVWDV